MQDKKYQRHLDKSSDIFLIEEKDIFFYHERNL